MVMFIQEDYVRCVWPDVALPLGKDGDYLVRLFKDEFDINIEYLEGTKTLPVNGGKSRIDQIFNVKKDSIDQFERIKSRIGAFYAKEIVRNRAHYVYMERVYLRYFKRSEDELVKSGELSKEDVYQRV